MQKTILIVDDEPGILQVLKHVMEIYNYKIITASGGHEALVLVESNPDISMIISDMRMEQGNGLQLLEALNGRELKIPFLLMTGFADISEKEILEKGAIGIMNKPFDIEKLLENVKAHTDS